MIHSRLADYLSATLNRFAADESGATAVEYGLIAGLVAVTAIAAFVGLGNGVQNLFGASGADTLESAASSV